VREDLPDLQRRRPEASATLCAVLDRMTEKDLERRYADVDALVADLEEALAIETARSGTSTGEATAVLRTLPVRARRRLPLRLRSPLPVVALMALMGAAAAAIVLIVLEGADHTQRGTGPGRIKPDVNTQVVSVGRTSARDYDPLSSDKQEHRSDAFQAVDRDPGTSWTTEHYEGGTITKPDHSAPPGVGLYVDARPGVDAVRMTIQTPHPGWKATIYAAPSGAVPASITSGWTKLGGGTVKRSEQRFNLTTDGRSYRYYLVWITALPPGQDQAAISEVALLAPKR
jgi:serine/threonine-protein kinase